MKKTKTLLVVPLLSLMLLTIIPSSANFSVDCTIIDVYYTNLDDDLIEDDIFMELRVTLTNPYVKTDVDIYVGITLPSGTEHWFLAEITVHKTTFTKTFTMTFDLLDTAYETGWYNASAVGFAAGETFSLMHTVTFDPPGSGGGNPLGFYTVYY